MRRNILYLFYDNMYLNLVYVDRSCGYLEELANGKKLSSNHQYGQSVNFQCNTGYRLVGSPTLTCQSNGLWTADEPTCQSKQLMSHHEICHLRMR